MTHPKNNIEKVYLAKVEGIITKESLKKLCNGLHIDGYKTSKAKAKILKIDKKTNRRIVELIIHEGKNHQVKRMFESVGCSPFNSGLFEAMKKNGAQGIFCGHDHVNDFHIKVDGISLYQTIGCGYFTYGREHGGRLIVLDENNPRELYTESIEIPQITDLKK